jgi:hypothetical protein
MPSSIGNDNPKMSASDIVPGSQHASTYIFDVSKTLFPKLPTELRCEIYSYLLPAEQSIVDRYTVGFIQRSIEYSIFRVNRATRVDVGLYFIATHAFCVESIDHFWKNIPRFLAMFPDELGFHSLRKLHIHHFSEIAPVVTGTQSDNMRLIARCPGLRYLALHWDSRHLLKGWSLIYTAKANWDEPNWAAAEQNAYAVRPIKEIIDRYQLDRLLASPSLDRIVFTVKFWAHRLDVMNEGHIMDSMNLMRELGEWLEGEFGRNGRTVKVSLEEPQRRVQDPSFLCTRAGYIKCFF